LVQFAAIVAGLIVLVGVIVAIRALLWLRRTGSPRKKAAYTAHPRASRVRGVQTAILIAYREEGVKVSNEERSSLVGQMGQDVTAYDACATRGEWPTARMFLTRLTAAVGALAMEVDENDPVGREN
jgi:hypothetical protein